MLRLRVTYTQLKQIRTALGAKFAIFHSDDIDAGKFTAFAVGDGYPVAVVWESDTNPGVSQKPATYASDFPSSIPILGYDF